MFLERVPVHPMIGRTAGQFLAEYGIATAHLKAVLDLPQNRALRDGILARTRRPQIEPSTDLVQLDPSRAPGGSTLLLPIEHMQIAATRSEPQYDPTGLRPQGFQGGQVVGGRIVGGTATNQAFLNLCTHGLAVRFERAASGWNSQACNRIRWIQTVRKVNNPHQGRPDFVDRHGGDGVPWYNAENPDPLLMTDTPCGPEAPAPGKGLQFAATTSLAVWTLKRVTLIASYSWGMTIKTGKDKRAVEPTPTFRAATAAEIGEHLGLLRIGQDQDGKPTGSNLIYRPIPAANAINEGL